MTRYRVISPSELDVGLQTRWQEICSTRQDLASPYFHPAFTREVGRVRPATRVTIIEDGSAVAGFFPHERGRFGLARPPAGPFSDAHGVISVPGSVWDPRDLVRGSGLSGWAFDHLVPDQERFRTFSTATAASPLIDLSAGFEAYAAGVKSVRGQQRRKSSKLERERGPVTFAPEERDHATLDVLLGWKSDQCRATGVADMFGVRWTRDLLHNLLDTAEDGFAGILTALRVGGTPVALHMGMRSSRVWHWWFPSYSHDFSSYSPGVAMLLDMAERAPAMGISVIDLGKGEARYKDQLSNTATPLLEGLVEAGGAVSCVRSTLALIERAAARTPGRIAAAPFRLWRRRVRSRKYQ